jgi:hypothetical protein
MDSFKTHATSLESPAIRVMPVTPDDTVDLGRASRAINVATAGTVQITTVAGDTAIISVAAGIAFPVRARRIWATGTTATGIVALS